EPGAHPRRQLGPLAEKLVRSSELFVVAAAGLLVVVAVVIATGVLYVLFINGLRTHLTTIESVDALQPAIQRVFAGVLLLMLGLELLETLKTYFEDYHFRTEVILVVAIIAVGRHVIQIDFEHTSSGVLLGSAWLVLVPCSIYLPHRQSLLATL